MLQDNDEDRIINFKLGFQGRRPLNRVKVWANKTILDEFLLPSLIYTYMYCFIYTYIYTKTLQKLLLDQNVAQKLGVGCDFLI